MAWWEYKETPQWRIRCRSASFPPTTTAIVEQVNRSKPGNSELEVRDRALLAFVGVFRRTGKCFEPEAVHGRDLVEYHLDVLDEDFSPEDKTEVRNMVEAVLYAKEHISSRSIQVEEVVEIYGKVTGDERRSPFRVFAWKSEESLLNTLLLRLNDALAQLPEDETDALPRIKAAAEFCAEFCKLRPLRAGNLSVCEVIMAVILQDFAAFPLKTFCLQGDPGWTYLARISDQLSQGGRHGLPSLIAYIIDRVWSQQRFM